MEFRNLVTAKTAQAVVDALTNGRVCVTANPMALSGNMVGLSNPIYFNFDPNF